MERNDEYETLRDCDGCKRPVPLDQLTVLDDTVFICPDCFEDIPHDA